MLSFSLKEEKYEEFDCTPRYPGKARSLRGSDALSRVWSGISQRQTGRSGGKTLTVALYVSPRIYILNRLTLGVRV